MYLDLTGGLSHTLFINVYLQLHQLIVRQVLPFNVLQHQLRGLLEQIH